MKWLRRLQGWVVGIDELDARVKELEAEIERERALTQKLSVRNLDLQATLARTASDLAEALRTVKAEKAQFKHLTVDDLIQAVRGAVKTEIRALAPPQILPRIHEAPEPEAVRKNLGRRRTDPKVGG